MSLYFPKFAVPRYLIFVVLPENRQIRYRFCQVQLLFGLSVLNLLFFPQRRPEEVQEYSTLTVHSLAVHPGQLR